ncbi:MAG: alpha-ribazole phosphatase family protein [Opitutaceae bacterium]|nr:alpha-ribazole phosphatase family protein [Cytophagales bacterium]
MEVFLIRHTQPDIENGLIYGRHDVPLVNSFEQEKNYILEQLPDSIDLVFSSPSTRCTKLAEALSIDYIIKEELCELNFGDWEGKTWDTINRQESEFWMEDMLNRCPPGGESLLEMKNRVLGFWQQITSLESSFIALVTHKGVIRIILSELNNTPDSSFFDIKVDFGEVFKVHV